jgi:hypothetical protein
MSWYRGVLFRPPVTWDTQQAARPPAPRRVQPCGYCRVTVFSAQNELYLASWRQDCGYHGPRGYRTMGGAVSLGVDRRQAAWVRSAPGRPGDERRQRADRRQAPGIRCAQPPATVRKPAAISLSPLPTGRPAPWAVTLSTLLTTLVRHLLFRKAIRYADEWPCIVHQMKFPLHMDLASLLSFEVLSIVWFRRWQSFDGHRTRLSIPLRMPTTSAARVRSSPP